MKSLTQKIRELKVLKSNLAMVAFFLVFFFISTLIHPLWFTNSKGYIDAWIYWGAGDNPSLSYQNDFASTYYLQRYVVIVPKILAFSLFGSFWGQLVVGLFWISITFYYFFQISHRYIGKWSAFLLVLLFMSDPVLLGAFGSSYTMGPTIALYATFFFYLTKISKTEGSHQNIWSILLTGFAVACLSNAYLLHGLIILGISFLYLFYVKAVSVPHFLKYFLASLISTSVVFQGAYFFISGDWRPFILKQLSFGLSLASSSNHYGSTGFVGFWSTILSTDLTYYWLAIVVPFVFIAFYIVMSKRFEFKMFKVILLASISLLFGYLCQTFLHTNIFGYIWVSCGLYILRFLTLLFLVLILKLTLSEKAITSFLLIVVIYLLFIDSFSSLLPQTQFITFGALIICFLILLLVISRLMTFFGSLQLKKYITVGCASCLLTLLPTYSHIQDFGQYSVPFEGTFQEAKSYYKQISRQRSIILKVSQTIQPLPRSWLTPDSGVPLLSSQLYLYSMISNISEKANCAQVNWAGNYSSLIFSFGPKDLLSNEVTKLYLAECGYDTSEVPLSHELAKDLKNSGGQVWKLIPAN
jgi:hypothetical protein